MTKISIQIESAYPNEILWLQHICENFAQENEAELELEGKGNVEQRSILGGPEVIGMVVSAVIGITLNEMVQAVIKKIKKKRTSANLKVIEKTTEVHIIDLETGTKIIVKEIHQERELEG